MPVSNVKDDYWKANPNGNIAEKLLYVWSRTLYPGLDAISKWEENNSGALNNVSMAMIFVPGGIKSPIVAEEALDREQSQIEIRERVLKNIEESKRAREASNYRNPIQVNPEERTLNGYVENNAKIEISLRTDSSGFNSLGNAGGEFKRFGADSRHGIDGPHVHQPLRRRLPNGQAKGGAGRKTIDNGVTSPSEKDVKQLYDYLNNGKYR